MTYAETKPIAIFLDIGEIPRMLGRGLVGYPLIASMLRRWTRMLGIEGGAATWEALKNDLMKHLEYSVLDRASRSVPTIFHTQ